MAKMPIRIIDLAFNLYGEIDNYESLQLTRSWHGIGNIELRINRYMQYANELQRGRIIFPFNHLNKAYIIRHKEIELDENGKITENWVIKAMSLKSWLAERLTYPPSHTSYDNKSGDAESVMLHYVNNNVVNPVDLDRVMQGIVLADNLNRGSNLSWQSRYKVLSEELEQIGLLSGLGWNIELDIVNKQFVFKVLEGRNVTSNQSELPPVIFSTDFDSLKQLSYVESDLDYKNYAIVAGQGEGKDRRIVNVGESTGFERHELFVDARDVSEETEGEDPQPRREQDIINDLRNRGNQKLVEHEQEIYLEGQILTKSPFVYQKDYDLGDIATVQTTDWGVTMDARIKEIKEIYESSGMQIEAVFGNNRPTLISKIKQELSGMRTEITR